MIRTNGIYISFHEWVGQLDEAIESTFILLFRKNNLVRITEKQGFSHEEYLPNNALELEYDDTLSANQGQYSIDGDSVRIRMHINTFFDVENTYRELSGFIKHDKLYLTHTMRYWDELEENYVIRTVNENIIFKFYLLKEGKFLEEFIDFKEQKAPKQQNDYMESPKQREYNRQRNLTIAIFFGISGAILGVIFSGLIGLFVGIAFGVAFGFILKSFVD